MSERLEVHINDAYKGTELVSTAKIWKGKAMVSEWVEDDPRGLLHKGIEAADSDVFQQIKIKKMLDKAAKLFEPKTITIKGK